MGMFDTVHFPQPLTCVACQAKITSIQTKAFESLMEEYHIGDCIGHAEELRIVREGLYCEGCRVFDRQYVYFVVYRGILTDITLDLPTAENRLREFSFDRLLLWYHDLYAKRIQERAQRHHMERFLHDVRRWFAEGYHLQPQNELPPDKTSTRRRLLFFFHLDILEQSATPLEAIEAFLQQMEDEEGEVKP